MSLGLRAGSKLHDFLGLWVPYAAGKLQALVSHARAYAQHHHIEAAFRGRQVQAGWHISFHPAAPDIVLSLQGGYIVLDARTLETGPGYHAFVAGFIDYLTRQHQWVWDLRKATLHFTDDTGYYRDRNFAALQATMAGEFAAMCEGLCEAEADGHPPLAVWLPTEPGNLAADRFAATSLGFRDRAFFEAPSPERFFPWWDEGLTAQTLRNMALGKMWLEMSWLPPETEAERQDLQNSRALVDRARALGAEFADSEGVADIDALLRGEPLDITGETERIGYGRQDTWYIEPGDWAIALPGYFREEIGADGQLCSMLYGERAVYIRSYFYEEAQAEPTWPEATSEGFSEYLRFKTEPYWVVLASSEDEDEDGISWWTWQGMYNSRKGSARFSVVSSDPGDAPWAENVLRSVQPDFDFNMVTRAPTPYPPE